MNSGPTPAIMLKLDDTLDVSVKGFIAPIEYTLDNSHVEFKWDALTNLRVAVPEKVYSASVFSAFLPNEAVSVGHPWRIQIEGILELLRQLHPKPNLDMRGYGDPGAWACLRAYTDEFADILFRIHAEFQLGDGWFTPSQFTGHLVINRLEETVAFFHKHLPEGPVNFKVGWEGEESWEGSNWIGDTGSCSKMELRAGTEDVLIGIPTGPQNAPSGSAAITQEEAERVLNRQFYKSAQIEWSPMEAAWELAQAQQKPIHVISIDGPLVDEAC